MSFFLNKKEELDQIPMEVYGTEMEHHRHFQMEQMWNLHGYRMQDIFCACLGAWMRGNKSLRNRGLCSGSRGNEDAKMCYVSCCGTSGWRTAGDLWNQKQAFVSDRTGRRNFFRGSENRMMSMPAKERSFGKICRFQRSFRLFMLRVTVHSSHVFR